MLYSKATRYSPEISNYYGMMNMGAEHESHNSPGE